MTWSKDESQLDAQLAELFQKDMAIPAPVVQTQTLERMRRQREQNGLLAAVSVLSFLWFAVYLLTGVLLLELDWLWGVRVLLFVLASVCSAGLLAAALLWTEQQKQKIHLMRW